LSTGDSPAVKRSAATQIGEVVNSHPEEVELIVNKVQINHTKKTKQAIFVYFF